MASNTLSIYLPDPLFTDAKQAESDGLFKIKEVCALALQAAINAARQGQQVQFDIADDAQDLQPAEGASVKFVYEMHWHANPTQAQAYLDHVADNGATVQSMCVDPAGQIGLLVAWLQ